MAALSFSGAAACVDFRYFFFFVRWVSLAKTPAMNSGHPNR
jgi:hypothetical protein